EAPAHAHSVGTARPDAEGGRTRAARGRAVEGETDAAVDAGPVHAGIVGAGIAVVAAARAGTRPDARLEVGGARRRTLLRGRGAVLETDESIRRRRAALDAGHGLRHDGPSAGCEGLTAAVEHSARTGTGRGSRGTDFHAAGVIARAGALRGPQLIGAASHAG